MTLQKISNKSFYGRIMVIVIFGAYTASSCVAKKKTVREVGNEKILYIYKITSCKQNTFGFNVGHMFHDKTKQFEDFFVTDIGFCSPPGLFFTGKLKGVGFKKKEEAEAVAKYFVTQYNNGVKLELMSDKVTNSLGIKKEYYDNYLQRRTSED